MDTLKTDARMKGMLRIRKRKIYDWMLMILAFWPFLMKVLLQIPRMPSAVKYLADGILVLFLLSMFSGKRIHIRKMVLPFVGVVAGFALYTLTVYIFRFQSPFYYLWGMRNNFRFYVAFLLYAEMLSEKDGWNWLNILDRLFWINFILSIIQFVFLGYRGDYLGGIFGVEGASNGFTLVFISIVVTKSLLCYQDHTEKFGLCLMKCAAALLTAVMAEMKFFFVAFALILGLSALLTQFSWRKVAIIVGATVALVGFGSLLEEIFGIENLLSVEYLWEKATQENYSSQGDLNRLSAIGNLSRILVTKPLEQWFGLGLGNCDTSSFAICNTPFFRRYGYLHYTWFAAPVMFLETGYIGLGLFLLFFVMTFVLARKKLMEEQKNPLFCKLAMIMSLLCCAIAFYNSSLRIESAYMVYFVLALPFIKQSPTTSDTSPDDTLSPTSTSLEGGHPQ